MAIIGTGWAVRIQLPSFRKAGLNIVAVWARTEEKAKKLANELKIPFASSDFSEIVKRVDVDLVSIVTPPFLHHEMVLAALKAGKHVLCDKPFALNRDEALRMVEACKLYPNQLAIVDHELRFLPTFRKLRELVQQGKCGKLLRVDGKYFSNWKLHTKHWDWWSEEEKGGGLLLAIGTHIIDALTYFTGRKAELVFGYLHTGITHREDDATKEMKAVTSDDDISVHVEFEGKLPGLVQACAIQAGKNDLTLSIVGTDGLLRWNNGKLYWTAAVPRDAETELIISDEIELLEGPIDTIWGKGSIELGKAIIEASTNGNKFLFENAASFEEGYRTQVFVDTVIASHKERQPKQIIYN